METRFPWLGGGGGGGGGAYSSPTPPQNHLFTDSNLGLSSFVHALYGFTCTIAVGESDIAKLSTWKKN